MGMNATLIATGHMTAGVRSALFACAHTPFNDVADLANGARVCLDFPGMNTSAASRDLAKAVGAVPGDVATHALDNTRLAALTLDSFGPVWDASDNCLISNLGEAEAQDYVRVLTALAGAGFDIFWRAG